jgi:4-oxalocrotonate tautomerase
VPIIEVKAFEPRFSTDGEKARALIERLTDAVAETYGEELREETWVILEGVQPERWGFGGKLRSAPTRTPEDVER